MRAATLFRPGGNGAHAVANDGIYTGASPALAAMATHPTPATRPSRYARWSRSAPATPGSSFRGMPRASRPRSVEDMDIFALFHPSAHDARLDWQTRQQLPAPAPTPRGAEDIIDHGRIVIEISAPAR